MFSPDGKWLAYVSDESGREEVYARPFLGEGGRHTLSTTGSREPMWSRDGETLFYRGLDDAEMWAVPIELEPSFSASKPELLFKRLFFHSSRQQSYDVSPDGRFLMLEENDLSTRNQLIVVVNWAEELRTLAPVN